MLINNTYHIYPSTLKIRKNKCFKPDYPEFARSHINMLLTELSASYRKAVMPLFICDVVPMVFLEHNIPVEYIETDNPYSISVDLLEKHTTEKSIVLIPNYFGMQQNLEGISEVCKKNGCFLIIDNAQQLDIMQTEKLDCDYAVLYSHRKFYFGGKGILFRNNYKATTGDTDKSNALGLKTKIKSIVGQHTNTDLLKNKLGGKYMKCHELFSTYIDDGFIMPEDFVPLGIPLKLNNNTNIDDIDTKELGRCYVWPRYCDDVKERKNKRSVLVIPIHNMESCSKVKRLLVTLRQKGILA